MSSAVDEVLRSIDYRTFYRRHIPDFSVNGKADVLCHCVFHKDTKPSLSVNIETGLFFCHACGEKGNAVQFIQKKEGLDFKAALQRIKGDSGMTGAAPPFRNKTSATPRRPAYLTLDQVKILHNALLNHPEALTNFQSKYGLDGPTIDKYLLGFQNDHFVIPIEVEPGHWFYKEHHGIQSRGAKASIYPSDVVRTDLPFIVITEGEFKALLLSQLGFPAVSGTSGAATWRKEWNSLFAGLDVILTPTIPMRQGVKGLSG